MEEKQPGRSIPLMEGEDLLPTVIDGRMRADAVLAEVERNRKDRPDITEEELQTFEMPRPRPEGITLEIDSHERHILVHFKDRVVAVLKWVQSVGKFKVKRLVAYTGGAVSRDPVEHWTDIVGMWSLCREYGITVGEFVKAFREFPAPGKWTFEQCPWKSMDCKLRPAADPQVIPTPDQRCITCQALFGMDVNATLTLKEAGTDPKITVVARVPEIPPPSRPTIAFAKEFTRWRGGSQAKLTELVGLGLASWEKVVGLTVEQLMELGFRRAQAEELLEMAKERM